MDKSLEIRDRLSLQFAKRGGLIPVIVQDHVSKDILMLGYANQAAIDKTIQSGLATFWSTSRNALWTKGETSGDFLQLVEARVDCDQDALLYIVERKGEGTCHTKNAEGRFRKSCFYRRVENESGKLSFLEK